MLQLKVLRAKKRLKINKVTNSEPERRAPVAGFGVPGEARLAGVIEQPSCVPDVAFDKQIAIQAEAKNLCISAQEKCIDPSLRSEFVQAAQKQARSDVSLQLRCSSVGPLCCHGYRQIAHSRSAQRVEEQLQASVNANESMYKSQT